MIKQEPAKRFRHIMKLKEHPTPGLVDPVQFKSRHNVNDSVVIYFGNSGVIQNCKVIKIHFAEATVSYDVEVKWTHEDNEYQHTDRLYNLHSSIVFNPNDFEQPSAQHPEDYCEQCGGKNVVWSADNDLWNELMEKREAIICPQCFEKLAEDKGVSMIFKAVK